MGRNMNRLFFSVFLRFLYFILFCVLNLWKPSCTTGSLLVLLLVFCSHALLIFTDSELRQIKYGKWLGPKLSILTLTIFEIWRKFPTSFYFQILCSHALLIHPDSELCQKLCQISHGKWLGPKQLICTYFSNHWSLKKYPSVFSGSDILRS